MQSVKFVGLDSKVHEIVPSGLYVQVQAPEYAFLPKAAHFHCGLSFDENNEDLIDQAISLIAGSPEFLSEKSIHWILAYSMEYSRLFRDIIYDRNFEHIRINSLMDSIKQSGNVIYISRLVSVIRLINLIINGSDSFTVYGRETWIFGLVGDDESEPAVGSAAYLIRSLSRYVESPSFKGIMTRCNFRNAILSFSPPPGEVYTLRFEDHTKILTEDDSVTIRIEDYRDYNYRSYGNDGVFGHPGLTTAVNSKPLDIDYVGNLFGAQKFLKNNEEDDIRYLRSIPIHVPHNWISHICEYTETGLTNFPVPNHKYYDLDPRCMDISMPKPSIHGEYTECLSIAASCFSFAENGIDFSKYGNSFSRKEIKSLPGAKTITTRSKALRIAIDELVNGHTIYIVDTASQFSAINFIAKYPVVYIYKANSTECDINVAVCKGQRGPMSVMLLKSDIVEHIKNISSTVEFLYPEENLRELQKIIFRTKSSYFVNERVSCILNYLTDSMEKAVLIGKSPQKNLGTSAAVTE